MVDKGTQAIINSIVEAEIYEETGEHPSAGQGSGAPLVTVSRSFGSNGTVVARLLAERLGVRMYDRTLIKEVSRTAKADKNLMALLDERVTSMVDSLVQSFMVKDGGASTDTFYRSMIKVILGISQVGGVIVGRGAHLLLPNRKVFRLRVDGSLDICTNRVSDRLGIRKGRARDLVIQTNKDRVRYVRKIYSRYSTTNTYYDMVINSDIFTPEQIVEIVIVAMEKGGFDLPK
ncbi:MAG: cytidylate kinase-like family protein [Magnetococcales bacterium]|nr:cytidylate kinase-like family protein [Magnetococcales bacterium]